MGHLHILVYCVFTTAKADHLPIHCMVFGVHYDEGRDTRPDVCVPDGRVLRLEMIKVKRDKGARLNAFELVDGCGGQLCPRHADLVRPTQTDQRREAGSR